MPARIIFLPGRSFTPDDIFYKTVGTKLEQFGFEAIYLQVSNPKEITKDYWLKALEQVKDQLDSHTYLVAHSLGALATCRFLSDNSITLRSLHLMSGVFDQNVIPGQSQEITDHANQFLATPIDYAAINRNCWQIHLHHSMDDDRVGFFNLEKYAKALPKASIHTYTDRLHFQNQTEFEELTGLILQQEATYHTQVDGKPYSIQILDKSQLPLELPEIADFAPSKDGKSPLSKSDWIVVKDDQGNSIGKHESDTMPNWAGSSWYYLRYTDPKNSTAFADPEKLAYWLPVDHYFGGNEHTTVHLLYSRFWHRFLHDQGYVPTPEPYDYRTNGGILLGPDGQKMSKSKGNVINPQDKLDEVGVDALRLYIAFIGPYDATVVWQDGGLKACKRLVDTIFVLSKKVEKPPLPNTQLNQQAEPVLENFDQDTIKKDYENGIDRVDVSLVITNSEGKVLITQRSPHKKVWPLAWIIPGGKVESDENISQAIAREAKEELDLSVTSATYTGISVERDMLGIKSKVYFFHVMCDGEINLDHENQAYTFIEKSQISQYFMENMVEKTAEVFDWLETKQPEFSLDKTESVEKSILTAYHKMVRNITEQIQELRNNVAVAELMTFTNFLKTQDSIPYSIWSGFLRVLAPFAPYTAEEQWYQLHDFDENDATKSIHLTRWPSFDPQLCIDETVTIAVQVNGKLRATFEITKDAEEAVVLEKAKESVHSWLEGKELAFSKVIPNKIVTFAVK